MSDRKYRQHPLSFIPGGCNVTIVNVNGYRRTVDWVKYPKRYIGEMLEVNDIIVQYGYANARNMVAEIYVNDELVWTIEDEEAFKIIDKLPDNPVGFRPGKKLKSVK